MAVKPGYKQTEVGVIPEEWDVPRVGDVCGCIVPGRNKPKLFDGDIPWITTPDLEDGKPVTTSRLGLCVSRAEAKRVGSKVVPPGSVLMSCAGELGIVAQTQSEIVVNQQLHVFLPTALIDDRYLLSALSYRKVQIASLGTKTAVPYLNKSSCNSIPVPLPALPEQRAIATALSDVDVLLGSLDRLIAKKRDLKQAVMQQLLTGHTRLPGFIGRWTAKALEDSTGCLDGVRVPLNEAQRAAMQGDHPYCGANGVLDFVNGFVIDDDIILMAEDGGYFDEYETRPIAYRMKGKCWVNNHAHILKAKPGFDQGFLFYSLVHKNILPFLASGTRAKLNKSEMNKIQVRFPDDAEEQTAIAEVLTDMDAELAALEQRREKTRALKQAMMQELLSGRTRLVGGLRDDGLEPE